MPRIAQTYGAALHEATRGLGKKDAEAAVAKLVEILAARNELYLAPKILDAYGREARRDEGVETVRFASAEEVPAKMREDIAAALAKSLGTPVDVAWETDPSLLAGAVIRYADVLVDASVKGSLDRLKKRIA